MRIKFLGSGDAFGSGGRLNTCFLVEHSQGRLLIDCGASAMISLHRFAVDPKAIDLILISHLHGDHFGGLPFFLLHAVLVSRRKQPLRIVGPPGLVARLDSLCEAMFPGAWNRDRGFDLDLVEIAPGTSTPLDAALMVETFEVDHLSGAPSLALRLSCDGQVLAFTGDTQWTDVLLDVGQGADLLVGECYSFEKTVPFHLTHQIWREKAVEIGAKRIILTHMSGEMLDRLPEAAFETAHDGLEIDLG